MVDVYPPRALPPSDATDDTPVRGVLAPRVNLLADAVAGLVRVLGPTPQGTEAASVTAAQAGTLTRLARLAQQIDEVYSVLSQAASGSNGDLLNRINGVRTDLAAAVTRITTVEEAVALVRGTLGDLAALRAGYGTLVERLAAPNPAPALFASWDGTGTLLNASPVRLHAMGVGDPGYPFRLQVSGQLRIGAEDESTGSEWNVNIFAANSDGSGRYFVGVAAQPTIDARVKLLRFDFPVQDVVHRQAARVEVEAVRARGLGRGEHNATNRELRVARWRA